MSGRVRYLLAIAAISVSAYAAPLRPQVDVTGYVITADLDPSKNQLTATAKVTFTALEDLSSVTLELNNGLKITKLTDGAGATLSADRVATDSTVHITPAKPLAKGETATYTFEYAGVLKDADTSPVEGIKMAAIADPISILLYPGRWFPLSGLYTDRFTAEMHIVVPKGETAIASGAGGHKDIAGGKTQFDFNWTKPGLPGTVIAGKFTEKTVGNIRTYTTEKHTGDAAGYGETAAKEFEFMSSTFGQPESTRVNLVELPDDAVSSTWGPEIAAIAGSRWPDHNSYRLLANTVSRQWWGSEISPATLNDAWITNGMARYSELMYMEDANGKNSLQTAIPDISAGALAYDTVPISSIGRLDPFSPQFQSMSYEKGAMVYHMLRWEIGNDNFIKFLRNLLSVYTDKSVRSSDLQSLAGKMNPQATTLEAFFAQWIDGTGAPAFQNKYTVFRLGSSKGFRTIGQITQDLDLFRMPVELRIETDGKTEIRRIDVSGSESQYTVETFGRPRRVTIDPENWVLKSTPDLAVRVAVLRGQQQAAQGDLIAALNEYQKALDANKNSSLANYRIGEIFFLQKNYQSAANAFRDTLRGDGDPKWTEVWSHIKLGNIFDVTGQRDRAVNEYRLAIQTNDNTQGAINEARARMASPYKREKTDE
ncbi:MAG: peptidase M1 [Acidobacteria bacterium]|nr:peptidase M1 [Acidobacteriota bacterium]